MANHNNHEEHHIIPIPIYLMTFGVLIMGTIITIFVAEFDFGKWNMIIAMLVATFKASFVMLYFMHLRYDSNMNRVIFGSGFAFLILLFAFTLVDIITRVKQVTSF